MTLEPLKLLSASVVTELASSITSNVERYRDGDFADLARTNGWEIETSSATYSRSDLANLEAGAGPETEVKNSLTVYNALHSMTPALAREERLWARLCHVECLEFARQRWLKAQPKIESAIKKHFFAPSLPGSRDDNAIGRLWWNGYVASIASPGDIERGLRTLLSRANIRLQIFDRADTAFRKPLIQGIARLLRLEPWFESRDSAINDFMYEVNKQSGGLVFEAMSSSDVDAHLRRCLEAAKRRSP